MFFIFFQRVHSRFSTLSGSWVVFKPVSNARNCLFRLFFQRRYLVDTLSWIITFAIRTSDFLVFEFTWNSMWNSPLCRLQYPYCFEIWHLIGCSHTHIGRDVQSVSPYCSFYWHRQKKSRLARSAAIESNVSLHWTQFAPINLYPYPIENSIRFLMYRFFFILNCLNRFDEVIDSV